jgi:hypothetical protein
MLGPLVQLASDLDNYNTEVPEAKNYRQQSYLGETSWLEAIYTSVHYLLQMTVVHSFFSRHFYLLAVNI